MRRHLPNAAIVFRVITLWEPPKAEMMPFLEMEHAGQETPKPPARLARVQAYVDELFTEFKIDLDRQAVVSREELRGRLAHIDGDYMRKVELACLEDPKVKEQIAALNLPEGATVIAEPWTYGPDGMNDMSERMTMVCRHRHYCPYTCMPIFLPV